MTINGRAVLHKGIRIAEIFFFLSICPFLAAQDVLRGEICEEMEPVYAVHLGIPSPIDASTATMWALEDAQSTFSAMIYGWSFDYTPANPSRSIEESINLIAQGEIPFGDERMEVTDARRDNDLFFIWVDYELSDSQKRRMRAWNSVTSFSAQAQGFGSLQGETGIANRKLIKHGALEDAAKRAIKEKLRRMYKNRPMAAYGFIALSQFPIYKMKSGLWSAVAHFRIEIKTTEGYSVY
ncbi:MAG: hypothetical protein Ta2B_00830 [Termitinemataceae bacterium]|nr:MAG: hypothetical protein Ta2B_00830 [Termitinemataceae bacterium]